MPWAVDSRANLAALAIVSQLDRIDAECEQLAAAQSTSD